MKQLRKLLTIAAAVTFGVMLLGGSASAAADVDVDAGNDTTGANSENKNDTILNLDEEVEIDNWAHADNDLDLELENGDNDVDSNTTVDSFTSGDISLAGTFMTALNSTDFDLGFVGGTDVNADFGNDTTGASSINKNYLTVNHDAELEIDNDAWIDNDIDLEIETGDNDFDSNTTIGDIHIGGADIELNVSNTANTGSVDLPAFGPTTVDVSGGNSVTGANSLNTNTSAVNEELEIEIDNDAHIDNDVDVDVDSGDNDITSNTTVGDVRTGDIRVNLNFTNTAN